MSTPAARLLELIRSEAKSGLWSSGVNLARGGAVAQESRTASEVVLRVKAAGRPVPWTAILYPGDEAWECNCPSRVDPCEHVVAAAIVLQQAEQQGGEVVAAENRWTRVGYRFGRVEGGLQLQRVLLHSDGREEALQGSVAGLLSAGGASRLQVEQHDLLVDRLLEKPTRGAMQQERLDALLRILEPSRTVLLDGRPVAVSGELVAPLARVEDRGEQFAVVLERDPRVTAVVSPGVALCGDVLCRLSETNVSGAWLQSLPVKRFYAAGQAGELAARVLPELARRHPVEVRTKRLPRVDPNLKPRIQLELDMLESGLSVLPSLVYGAPPRARVDQGRLVHLRGAVPLRDEALESQLTQKLREDLGLVPGRRMTVQGAVEMAQLGQRLKRWEGDLTGTAAASLGAGRSLQPVLGVEGATKDGVPHVGFALHFRVEEGGREIGTVSGEAVVRAWQEGLGLVPLTGGGWAPLPAAWMAQHGERVAALLQARKEDGQLANHALPRLAELCDALDQPPPPGLDKLAPLVQGFERLPEPVLPADLAASLRPYQLHGVAWLGFLQGAGLGGVLADDMGLGKTLQAACVLGPRTLVVCPTSVLPNWRTELQRFRPGLKVCSYHGPGRALDPSADVTLTSYALLRLDASVLSGVRWRTVVLDEAQAIKNPDSQVTRAAYGLDAEFRLALSGTPVENRLEELWSVMHFANPGLLGGRRQFADEVAQGVSDGRAGAAQELRKRIRPFVLRRLKRDVAPELPPRTESVLHVSLDERERAVYDAVHAATRKDVVALLEGGGGVMQALEALLRLRQAACHAGLVPGQVVEGSSKIASLVEALQVAQSGGHRSLVFSQWTSLLDKVEPALQAAGITFSRLDGSTPNRGELVSTFQSGEGPDVMLLSLKAGGTGLNLTAADHVFLLDPWWNPAAEAQAADRAHRIGQERPVFVYRLVSDGTVEERILGLQEKKRALFEAALGEGGGASSLTKQDLLELFA